MLEVIVGLGNPGRAYRETRHNIGFDIVDELAYEQAVRFRKSWTMPLHWARLRIADRPVWLVKPQTYMNASGRAVAAFLRKHAFRPEQAAVVFDDVDMDLGRLRVRARGSAGGHNGVQSMIDHLGSGDFPRLRAGVGPRPEGHALVDYVLGTWPENEREAVRAMRQRAAEALRCMAEDGMSAAMNRFNG